MKSCIVFLCCTAALGAYAGLGMNGPITLVDAAGESRYEHLEMHDIIGDVDGVELIGFRECRYESRGYFQSAAPSWIAADTNVTSRPYQILAGGRHEFLYPFGLGFSLVTPTDTNRLFAVCTERKESSCKGRFGNLDPKGLYRRVMVDASSGLAYKACDCGKFDDGSDDRVMVSFYSNETGAVKVWYEVVSGSLNEILAKGWVSGRIEGAQLKEVEKSLVHGGGDVKIQLTVRDVRNRPANVEAKSMSWLHVTIQRENSEVSVGTMLKCL